METSNERLRILDMIEDGSISAQEGLRLLQGLNENDPAEHQAIRVEQAAGSAIEAQIPLPAEPPAAVVIEEPVPPFHAPADRTQEAAPSIRKWKRWWMVPLWIGVAGIIFGGLFMYQAMQTSGYGFWFFCASLPLVLGIALMVLAWQTRNSPWLHLRIQQKPGESPQRIAFSFPLPLRLAAWFTRTFGRYIPDVPGRELGQMIQAVDGTITPENPIFIEVDEGDGEHVEIYIG